MTLKRNSGKRNAAMKLNEGLDPNKDQLSPEKLRKYNGFENLSEAEALNEIEKIKSLAKVLYYFHLEEIKKESQGEGKENNDNENDHRQFGT